MSTRPPKTERLFFINLLLSNGFSWKSFRRQASINQSSVNVSKFSGGRLPFPRLALQVTLGALPAVAVVPLILAFAEAAYLILKLREPPLSNWQPVILTPFNDVGVTEVGVPPEN